MFDDGSHNALDSYNGFPDIGGSTAIPQTYLLDRDGTVRKAILGAFDEVPALVTEWTEDIENLLGDNFS